MFRYLHLLFQIAYERVPKLMFNWSELVLSKNGVDMKEEGNNYRRHKFIDLSFKRYFVKGLVVNSWNLPRESIYFMEVEVFL